MQLSYEFKFEAAHALRFYQGQMEPIHGHSWRCILTLQAELGAEDMVFDFVLLKNIVKERLLPKLDHQDLNGLLTQSTAENVAIWIWKQLTDLPLFSVQVFEEPGCSITYFGK